MPQQFARLVGLIQDYAEAVIKIDRRTSGASEGNTYLFCFDPNPMSSGNRM